MKLPADKPHYKGQNKLKTMAVSSLQFEFVQFFNQIVHLITFCLTYVMPRKSEETYIEKYVIVILKDLKCRILRISELNILY